MRLFDRRSIACGLIFLGGVLASHDAAVGANPPSAAEPTFERDVRPILKKHCFQCHGEGKVEGGLDVRLRRLIAEGGDSGAALVDGRPDESLLWQRIAAGEMPPEEVKLRLTAAEQEKIRRWLVAGAKTARPEPADVTDLPRITEEERSHWSFQPVRRPAAPAVKHAQQVRTPIDAFILSRLESRGLALSPDADPATLCRRLYFDLLGLPPTPEQVEEFVRSFATDEGAYEKLVDQLLASPHYGERWGRHWLDVAGYADSEGYHDDDALRNDAFRYRDYVIRSLNDDKPFDRFLVEQLAGDELVPSPYRNLTPEQVDLLTATGYLRMAPDGTGQKNCDQDAAKNAVVAETLKIVSTSLLGMTVGCAECHDHRYDPIPQTDYYRLRAIFEPALDWKSWKTPQSRQISLADDAQRAEVAALFKESNAAIAKFNEKMKVYQAWVFEREVEQLPADLREDGRVAGLQWQKDPTKLSPEQKKLIESYPSLRVSTSPTTLNLFLQKYKRGDELKADITERDAPSKKIAELRAKEHYVRALTEPTDVKPPQTFLFLRGNSASPGEEVGPGDLSVLSGGRPVDFSRDDPKLPTTGRRLAFAKHLTDGAHPLVPRVLVNRFWLHHFGRGLVNTPGDFGAQGERPTHPELLDWLADEFVRGGWRLKSLHKTIVLSSVYRQTSARRNDAERIDAGNELYWRANVRRLEAETIRDAVLAASGKLNRLQFGPPVLTGPDATKQIVVGDGKPSADGQEFRRSVYVQVRRSQPAYLLKVFDAPVMEPNCELRNNTNVAPQALMMLNGAFVVEQAEALALKIEKATGRNAQAQAAAAWQAAYGVEPSAEDLDEMTAYLAEQTQLLGKKSKASTPERAALASLCQVLFGSNRFLYVD
jgi:hypothetical protein